MENRCCVKCANLAFRNPVPHRIWPGALIVLIAGSVSVSAQVHVGWTAGVAEDGAGTIMHSSDSGASWTRQGLGQLADADLGGVKAVDADTAWVVGMPDDTGYSTIYNTVDRGVNWTRYGVGQAAIQQAELRKVQATSNGKIWAVGSYLDDSHTTHGVIAHSSDGGSTWVNQYPSDLPGNELQGLYTSDGQHIWATGTLQTDPASGKDFALILHSDDGGQSWTRQTGGDITNWTHVNGISAANNSQVWAIPGFALNSGAGNGIIYSDNEGQDWTRQTDTFGGLFDGNEIDVVDDQVVWAVNDSYVLRTTDGGTTWEGFGQNAEYIMGVSGASESEAWAVLQGNEIVDGQPTEFGAIYHTNDGGASWETYGGYDSDLAPLWTIDMVTIPEPSGLMLAVLGGILLLVCTRRAARSTVLLGNRR